VVNQYQLVDNLGTFMPRTKEAANIKAWRMEQLIRDLALGDKSMAELSRRV
jgi:hypothetical protein